MRIYLLFLLEILCDGVGDAVAVYGGRDDASGIAGTFAAWEQSADADVGQCLGIARNSHGR